MRKLKRFFNRIKNLIRWFLIIWKDQDWDDYYIFEILKFKLKNQAKYIGDRDCHVNAKRDAEKMMLCVRLIEKIQEEYYSCEYTDYHHSNFNWIDSKEHEDLYELEIEEVSERLDEYFQKYPRIYKQVLNANKTPFSRDGKIGIAINIGKINEDKAHKLLFKILEENIRRWWD